MSSLPQRLRLLRHRHGLTQRALAEKMSISNGAIANYETGKREPDLATLRRLAAFFHVSVAFLLGEDLPVRLGQTAEPYDASSPEATVHLPIRTALPPDGARGDVEGVEPVNAALLEGGNHFFWRVQDDAMTGGSSPLNPGYLVLIREQRDVEDGELALVAGQGEGEALIRRVHKVNGSLLLAADNPAHPPQLVSARDVIIVGKVIEVRFQPAKRSLSDR